MSGENLWVWVGSPDDRLDVLRYVRATDVDVLCHPAARRVVDRMAANLAALRAFARDVESECRSELARWKIHGLASNGPHAQLWLRLRDRARFLLGSWSLVLVEEDPGRSGWDGPGWYFSDETGGLHGPFANRPEAEKALAVYATMFA